jgi:hypothetical protein
MVLTISLLASTVYAQSAILASGERESKTEAKTIYKSKTKLELEYAVDEGGVLKFTEFRERKKNYSDTCFGELTVDANSAELLRVENPSHPYMEIFVYKVTVNGEMMSIYEHYDSGYRHEDTYQITNRTLEIYDYTNDRYEDRIKPKWTYYDSCWYSMMSVGVEITP